MMAQAQRKALEQFSAASEQAAQHPQGEVTVALSEAIQSADHYRASPARQMQEQLAAWADGSSTAAIVDMDKAAKLPAWQRSVVIGGASLALWAAILSVAGTILPIW